MQIHLAEFITSASNYSECPESSLPEFSMIGRSNVGKSSLINWLTNQKGLAKTSSKPGKTQLINFFNINNNWSIIDLPGYGYAKTSKAQQEKFNDIVSDYLQLRPNHLCTFLLIDSRLKPQAIDLAFAEWLVSQEIPFVLIFTKSDKCKKAQLESNVAAFKEELTVFCTNTPRVFLTSSLKKESRKEILEFIATAVN